jgi:hypothetical protein
VFDQDVRRQIIDGQRRRVREFGDDRTDRELDRWLKELNV